MGKLDSKVALITGGSSGIGLATAKLFVAEGAYVFITGRRADELEKARQQIGRNVTTVQGDVSKLDDLDRLYETIAAEKGKLDVVVANAAYVQLATLANVTPEHFDKTFNVNARGTFFTVQKSLPLLNDGGAIVLVSSVAHLIGPPEYTVYSATKAAMRSFARSWASDLRTRQIRVNSLSPGPVETPILEVVYGDKSQDAREAFAKGVPLGRIGRAEEIAAGVLFLASSDSGFSTGIDLVADGGLTQF